MVTPEPFAQTGIAGLDRVLGGGFPRGQIHLIRGASGAGKTTLSLQFLMEGARRGEPVLYLGTSETEQEIQLIAKSHGWSLDGITLHRHDSPSFSDQTMLHPAEIELPQTIESMLAVIDQAAPTRLVIDSLAEIRVLSGNHLWYRRQLMTLKQHFANNNCTVLVVEIPNEKQPAVLDSVVSSVIELQQTTPLYGPDRRRLRATKIRGQDFISGYHDYRIRKGGIDLFPRLSAAEFRHSFPCENISTGLPEMDDMFHGGITRGTSLLLLGPSGTGKSLMATQLAVAAAKRGERSVFFVFDERVQTLFQRAEGIGLPFRRHVEEGTIEIRQIDPTEMTSGEFSSIVQHLVEQSGVRMIIIDSLNGYAYAMPDERLLSVHLHELASYLNQQGVVSIFTMTQHGLVSDSIQQPFDVSYIADSVVLFRHFEFAGNVHKALSVYKNRSGPHETSIREFQITPSGVRLGNPLTQFQGVLTGTPQFVGERINGHSNADHDQD